MFYITKLINDLNYQYKISQFNIDHNKFQYQTNLNIEY